jgi:hypothetical protein
MTSFIGSACETSDIKYDVIGLIVYPAGEVELYM